MKRARRQRGGHAQNASEIQNETGTTSAANRVEYGK